MKLTLLELTQNILSALNSDEVNSISDTAESMQVATCIQTSYLNMQGRYDLPEHNQLFQLIPSNDENQPTLMFRPDGVNRIEWVKYFDSSPGDGSAPNETDFIHDLNLDITSNPTPGLNLPGPGYLHVKIMGVQEFLDLVNSFNPAEADVGSFDLTVNQNSTLAPGTFTFYYKNDRQPQYCCIISNSHIIFDSFDNSQDTTLQGSKSLCYGWVIPRFLLEDTFTPDLDEAQVPLLLNEAKSLAFIELKNMPHQKAEQEVLRQLSSLQKFKALAHQPTPFDKLPYYGRL